MENAAFEHDSESCNAETSKGRSQVKGARKRPSKLEERRCDEAEDKVALRRSVGLCSCVGVTVGSIIGAGIFVSPKGVLIGSGSIGLALVIWLACGVYSFVGAACFAELGTLMPNSGGHYMYMLECFAPTRKKEKLFWGPLLSFLYNWQNSLFGRPATLVIKGMVCATYLVKLASVDCISAEQDKRSEGIHIKILCILLISLVTAVNCYSVNASTRLVNAFTVAKITALTFIVTGGVVQLCSGTKQALSTGFEDTVYSTSGIALAFYSGLYAYAGWEDLCLITREVKNPDKNMFRAMMTSCTVVTVIYMLTNVSYYVLLTKPEFLASEAVAVDFGIKLVGKFGGIFMILSIACSVFGGTIAGTLVGSRLSYSAAREAHMWDVFSFLNIHKMTPSPSIICTFILALMMMGNSNIIDLIMLSGFLETFFSGVAMIVLLIMRKTKKHAHRSTKVPLAFPVIAFAFNMFLFVAPLVSRPRIEYFFVLAFLLLGFVVYVPFVYYAYRIPGLDKVKKCIQLILQVAPPQDNEI